MQLALMPMEMYTSGVMDTLVSQALRHLQESLS
jgi:hypothetical protein